MHVADKLIKLKREVASYSEWNWCMEWCKLNNFNPAVSLFWNKSKRAYIEAMTRLLNENEK